MVGESDDLLRGWTLIQNKPSPVMMKVQKAKVAGSSDRRDASLVVCSHFFEVWQSRVVSENTREALN